jgi:PAS domain S-box-containing protein
MTEVTSHLQQLDGPHPSSTDAPDEALVRASFLDSLGEAVLATDMDGHIIYWNDTACDLFGWVAEEVLGSHVDVLLPPERTLRETNLVLERIRRRGRWSGDYLVRNREGVVFPVLITATTVRGHDGAPVGMVAVLRDNATQRKAEETARHAEQRVELMRRAAAAVIWEWDVRSGAIRANDALVDAFGLDTDQLEPTVAWWRSRIHPDDRRRVTESFDRFLKDDRQFWTEEYRFLTGDRGYATVFDRAYMAYDEDGRPTRVVGTLVDLTERRRMHEEQRFLSQSSMILELSLDYESTLPTIARLAVNSVADACILTVSPGDGFPAFMTAAHADPRMQSIVEEVADYLTAGPVHGSILERVLRDGEPILLRHIPEEGGGLTSADTRLGELVRALTPRSALVVPLRARRSVVGYAVLTSSDPDGGYDDVDLRMAEELGRRVGLTIDHARLFQSAELANQAKSDFLAIISHELRTPLTAVLGYADLLTEEVAGPLNEAQHRQVARIRAGSDRLLRLIEGILVFARLEAGHERPHFSNVGLHDLIRHIEDMIRPSAAEKGIFFQLEIGDVPAEIQTDGERFVQVVLSLLTNAIKFTERGDVQARVWAENGMLRVDVTDSGNGIAPEHLPHIFNPFWQAEQPATRRAGGAGLGLSIARRLARLINGDVHVASSTPEGTTFRFEIPTSPCR